MAGLLRVPALVAIMAVAVKAPVTPEMRSTGDHRLERVGAVHHAGRDRTIQPQAWLRSSRAWTRPVVHLVGLAGFCGESVGPVNKLELRSIDRWVSSVPVVACIEVGSGAGSAEAWSDPGIGDVLAEA